MKDVQLRLQKGIEVQVQDEGSHYELQYGPEANRPTAKASANGMPTTEPSGDRDAYIPATPALVEVMPLGLTLDEQVYWQVQHGEDRPGYIADAIQAHQGEVTKSIRRQASQDTLTERMEMGRTRFAVVVVVKAPAPAPAAVVSPAAMEAAMEVYRNEGRRETSAEILLRLMPPVGQPVDDSDCPFLPTAPSQQPAVEPEPAPAPIMPEGLTIEDQILWAATGGHRKCDQISAAIDANIVEVSRRLDAMHARYLLEKRVVDGRVNYYLYLPGTATAAVPQAPTLAPPKPAKGKEWIPGESIAARQHRLAYDDAQAARPSRWAN
jgi:hypothetical protein